MAQGPDLFVVCKNCRAEVSPYITECPYCGHRLRKRAPKLDKGGVPKPPKQRRRPPKPSLGRLRPGEMPGLRADGKPYATFGLVLVAVVLTILLRSGILEEDVIVDPLSDNDVWAFLGTSFAYDSTGYELAALFAIFLFGWLLERRHGHWAPLVVYATGTAAGIAASLALDADAIVIGGNAGALALLGAWVVRDLLAVRRNEETDADLLGVGIITVILLLLPAAVEYEAHWIAGTVGGLAGLVLGLALARLPER